MNWIYQSNLMLSLFQGQIDSLQRYEFSCGSFLRGEYGMWKLNSHEKNKSFGTFDKYFSNLAKTISYVNSSTKP